MRLLIGCNFWRGIWTARFCGLWTPALHSQGWQIWAFFKIRSARFWKRQYSWSKYNISGDNEPLVMAHYLIQYILYRYIDENLIIDVTFFCSLHFIICIWRFHVQKTLWTVQPKNKCWEWDGYGKCIVNMALAIIFHFYSQSNLQQVDATLVEKSKQKNLKKE